MSTIEYVFPDAAEILEIERDRALTLERESTIGQLMPFGTCMGKSVNWDQRDSVTGLLPAKRMGDPLEPINATGGVRKSVPASYFGAVMPMDLGKVVAGARYGTFGEKLDIGAELGVMQAEMAYRERQMIDLQCSRLLSDGVINVYDKDGTVIDAYNWEGYADRSEVLTLGDRWTVPATGDPILDMRRMADQYFRGTGYDFASGIVLASQKAISIMLNTEAVREVLKGRFGSTVATLPMLNEVFAGTFPTIVPVAMGANVSPTEFRPYIADNKVVFVGRHSVYGTQVGRWDITTSEVAGVGENIWASVERGVSYPYAPRVERAIQGAPYLRSDKQIAILEIASANDVDTYYS